MQDTTSTAPLIGVFDSGVGGLSVLKALRTQCPASPLLYVADSGHAPYGDRDPAHVIERSLRITRHLTGHGARMVVVACNTATAWAIEALRAQYPDLLLVGVEPGVKPAAARSPGGRIGVMATPATLNSARYARLLAQHAGRCEVVSTPCPGLAAAIEQGEAGRAEVEALLDEFCPPLQAQGIDTLVLGCTHYPFVAAQIATRLPGVHLLDTADAVARQALRLQGSDQVSDGAVGPTRLQTTGDTQVLERLAREGLGLQQAAEAIAL